MDLLDQPAAQPLLDDADLSADDKSLEKLGFSKTDTDTIPDERKRDHALEKVALLDLEK